MYPILPFAMPGVLSAGLLNTDGEFAQVTAEAVKVRYLAHTWTGGLLARCGSVVLWTGCADDGLFSMLDRS